MPQRVLSRGARVARDLPPRHVPHPEPSVVAAKDRLSRVAVGDDWVALVLARGRDNSVEEVRVLNDARVQEVDAGARRLVARRLVGAVRIRRGLRGCQPHRNAQR